MSGSQENFKNSNIELKVQKDHGCKTTFEITTSPVATEAAYEAAVKNVSKEVSLPGFRKGKSPRALILQKFKPQVESEFREIVVRNSLQEAFQLSEINPYSQNAKMNLLKAEALSPEQFFASFEFDRFPDVPSIETANLKIDFIEPAAVTEEKIEKRIEDLRFRHAEWEEITDRPAQEGDFVILDISELGENPQELHKESRFHLKEGKISSWARQIVIGQSVGETREGVSEPENDESPDTFESHRLAFTLKKIQKALLPELDDALAKKAGVDTIIALKEAIVKSVTKELENNARQQVRNQIKNEILREFSFDLPRQRVKELHDECHEIAEREMVDSSHQQIHDHAHQMQAEAEQSIRLTYLLTKAIKEHNIPAPTHEEIRQRATEYMFMRYMRGERDMDDTQYEKHSRVAESDLMTEKALDFLLERTKGLDPSQSRTI